MTLRQTNELEPEAGDLDMEFLTLRIGVQQ